MRLTNLKGLYYFYRVAQAESMKEAAEQLFVTQAAVSQQLRILEEHLGEPLFHRQHRRIELTDVGQRLLPYARTAFETLSAGLQEIASDPNPTTLTVSTLPSFASRWLVPRLGKFYQQHPDYTLMIQTSESLENIGDGQLDVALRFGGGDYDGLKNYWLMDDYIYPVCHPLYQQQQNLQDRADLTQATLLSDSHPEPGFSWKEWLAKEQLGVAKKEVAYNGAHYVTEAALAGQGVALLRHSLVADLISTGSLVKLFDREDLLNYRYYLCAPPHHFQREKVKCFLGWIESEIASFNSEKVEKKK